ncbi:hypothetical protein BK133_05190 [Paenibacillus sp. FSL H8-0548]|uniref:hypothetical protein n=1 Tax=Paenibacillus sp. FSL H8-0548 TaxID=1920422 RepID=UPI00096CBCD2|nr:hypothetical protein [Paenibacillus sp. FSL H8-0548]OMF37452.1 hypothetical protein BK133_05190 [Paenibacillus sp. FSL H8-0548]
MERLTDEVQTGVFATLKNHKSESGEFSKYEAFYNYSFAVTRLKQFEDAVAPHPIDEWHEDIGDVLWWLFPIQEPPYCGSPLDSNWPNFHTHWTPLIIPGEPDFQNSKEV